MKLKSQSSGASIFVLGNFAPLTYLPDWFGRKGIIGEVETKEAAIEFALPEAISFKLEWLHLTVDQGRVVAIVPQEPAVRVHDFVVSTLSAMLDSPVSGLGINRYAHYQCPDLAAWHKIGDTLAPKEAWGNLLSDNDSRLGGMRSLAMEVFRKSGDPRGKVTIRVEPSNMIQPGIYIDINDHYDLSADAKFSNAETASDQGNRISEQSQQSGEIGLIPASSLQPTS